MLSNSICNANKEEDSTSSNGKRRTVLTVRGHHPDFAEWWKACTNKVRRPEASRAYSKARTKATREQLLDGWSHYTTTETYLRGYPCNPATWLNQERWNDQPAEIRPTNGYDPHEECGI
jgi:hypothetical protein